MMSSTWEWEDSSRRSTINDVDIQHAARGNHAHFILALLQSERGHILPQSIRRLASVSPSPMTCLAIPAPLAQEPGTV